MQLSGVRPSVRLSVCLSHPNWPVYADVFEHPPPRLASQRPIWLDMTSVDTVTQWREDWSSASVLNHNVVGSAHFLYLSLTVC